MKYVLCIDETGNFEHHKLSGTPSRVGGYLCSSNFWNMAKSIMKNGILIYPNLLQRLNKYLNTKLITVKNTPKKYPVNLISKWTAILLSRAGRIDEAVALINGYEPLDKEINLFDTLFQMINSMLANSFLSKPVVSPEIKTGFEKLQSMYPGINKLVESKKILTRTDFTTREIACFLPFYYS